MKPNRLCALLSCIVLASGLAFAPLHAGAQSANSLTTPETTVEGFYRWFIERQAEDHGYALMDARILRYVAARVVDVLRRQYRKNELAEDAEYFTKVQDFDEDDWLAHTVVRPATFIDDIALVPVTFGSTQKKTDLVFLRKIDGQWKITKVVDTRDYQ